VLESMGRRAKLCEVAVGCLLRPFSCPGPGAGEGIPGPREAGRAAKCLAFNDSDVENISERIVNAIPGRR
jgi:hypothetical protein